MNRTLYRSVADRRIGGVAAGTATYFDVDPSISRVLWVLLAIFTGGAFLIVYLVMWAIVPEEPWAPGVPGAPAAPTAVDLATGEQPADEQPADGAEAATGGAAAAAASTAEGDIQPVPTSSWSDTRKVSDAPGPHVIFGVVLILIGAWFLAQQFLPWLNFGTLWPIGLVVIGVVVLVAALRRGG
jgi:phage shock protein PspC (stress-responsive transcriptional regulator)